MIKLTRINHQIVVVNPDHIFSVDAVPDTTLHLIGGETILVRETLDELIAKTIDYRRRIRSMVDDDGGFDAATVGSMTQERQPRDSRRPSVFPSRFPSRFPGKGGE